MADAQSPAAGRKELAQIADNAQDILMTADTLFPFTLFPDTIVIDRVKLTLKRRSFFNVAKVTSIQIDDILNVEANTGPFFGSLEIWTRFFSGEPLRVNYLRNIDALAIKRILQGFIIAQHRDIDCCKIKKPELVRLLHELGQEAVE
jgi:hypothetical protein